MHGTGRCYRPRPASPGNRITCAPVGRAPAPDVPAAAAAAAAAAAGSSTRSLSMEEFVLLRLMLPLVAESPAHINTADIVQRQDWMSVMLKIPRGSQCCCQRMCWCGCACCPCWRSHVYTHSITAMQTSVSQQQLLVATQRSIGWLPLVNGYRSGDSMLPLLLNGRLPHVAQRPRQRCTTHVEQPHLLCC
jgi:hypothetical protein